MRDSSRTWLNVGIGLLFCLVVVNGVMAYRNIRQLREDANLVAHTHEVLNVLERTESTVKDAETGQRGYLLTRDKSYLEPYEDALSRSKRELATLESLIAENARLNGRLPRLKELIRAKLNELATTVEMGKSGDFAGAVRRVSTDQGKRTMEEIRAAIDGMVAVERQLLVERRLADDRAYRSAVLGILISLVAGLAGLMGLLWLIRRHVDALREADRHKDEFLATLAHELRNPLAPISNALQLWPLVEEDHEEVARLQATMQTQVRQMTRLIDDLLDISRITQGKIRLRRTPVDLMAMLPTVIDAIRPSIDSGGQRLEFDVTHEPLVVDGDEARLSQALGNLLHNAAKYTGSDGKICVNARREGNDAVVLVQDNGIGIARQMLPSIFEMFRQGDQTMTRGHGGLGVGLALVKRLIELHGGAVEARSDGEGKGSTFIVRLPIRELPSDASRQLDSPGKRKLAGDLAKRRILVVDDVRASARTLAMMLESIGQEVAIAHDGSSAIKRARVERPEVVFLDIAMPEMNGYEVARQLRACQQTAQAALVALTGYGNEDARRRSVEAGFDRHLTKPTSIEQLTELLRTLPIERRTEDRSASAVD